MTKIKFGFDVDWPYPECDKYIITTRRNYKAKTEQRFMDLKINFS